MDRKHKYRLRVESCIRTIIDVHKRVHRLHHHEEILSQFKRIKHAVDHIDMSYVSEQDVVRVEKATNALLGEFRPLFEIGSHGPVYQKLTH